MKRSFSPLRYPGGKGKLHRLMHAILEDNRLEGSTYIEPFAGGAGLAQTLLFNGNVNRIWINDLDKSIYAFWYSVKYDTDNLCRLINDTPVEVDYWAKMRQIQVKKENIPLLDLGFSTFYLNRINRSGIIMGGVIGGLMQTGPFKIDARFNKKNLIARIQNLASYGSRLIVSNLNALDMLNQAELSKVKSPFLYLDPPYYNKADQLYVNHFVHKDHEELATAVSSLDYPWLVSYDNTPEIRHIYRNFEKREFSISYSASSPSVGKEVMFASPLIRLPIEFEDLIRSPDSVIGKTKPETIQTPPLPQVY